MKKILYLLALVSSIASAQYAPGVKYVPNKYDIPASAFPVAKASKAPSKSARAQLAASLPAINWSAPITITKGGTYTGNWRSDNTGTPAVLISTYDPVELVNCNIASAGDMIKMYGGTKVTARRNNLYGLTPTDNNQYGRAVNNYHPQYFIFENNYVEHTGGILIDHSDENTKYLTIRFNLIRNTDRRRTDGSPAALMASILVNTASIGGEIAWNQFHNVMDSSYVEDNINCGNIIATAANPLLIHDNFIFGAYPGPTTLTGYTGSGITIEGHPDNKTYETVSQFVRINNNQVISTGNAGININAGHDISTGGNTIISSGMYPNGVQSNIFWRAKALWNGSNTPFPSVYGQNLSSKGDTIGYVRGDQNAPYKGRNDYWYDPTAQVTILPSDNVSLPNVPITLATEQAEWVKWYAKLAKNGIVVGNAVNNPVIITGPIVTVGASVIIGKSITGTISVVDSSGKIAAYKAGTLVVSSDALATVNKAADDKSFTVTGIAAGVSTITISLTNLYGEVITKQVQVTVSLPLDRASAININWGTL